MFRPTLAAACALGLFVSAAHADLVEFDASITYDTALLTSGMGLVEVKKSIEAQARDVCTIDASKKLTVATNSIDRKCVAMVVDQATASIEAKEGVDFTTLTPAASTDVQLSQLE